MNLNATVTVSAVVNLPARLTFKQAQEIANKAGFAFEKADKGKGFQLWSNDHAPGIIADYDTINCDDARSDLHDLANGINPLVAPDPTADIGNNVNPLNPNAPAPAPLAPATVTIVNDAPAPVKQQASPRHRQRLLNRAILPVLLAA